MTLWHFIKKDFQECLFINTVIVKFCFFYQRLSLSGWINQVCNILLRAKKKKNKAKKLTIKNKQTNKNSILIKKHFSARLIGLKWALLCWKNYVTYLIIRWFDSSGNSALNFKERQRASLIRWTPRKLVDINLPFQRKFSQPLIWWFTPLNVKETVLSSVSVKPSWLNKDLNKKPQKSQMKENKQLKNTYVLFGHF